MNVSVEVTVTDVRDHTRIATSYNNSFLSPPAVAALVGARVRNSPLKVLDSDEDGNVGFAPAHKHCNHWRRRREPGLRMTSCLNDVVTLQLAHAAVSAAHLEAP